MRTRQAAGEQESEHECSYPTKCCWTCNKHTNPHYGCILR